jgi:hypothetical protein
MAVCIWKMHPKMAHAHIGLLCVTKISQILGFMYILKERLMILIDDLRYVCKFSANQLWPCGSRTAGLALLQHIASMLIK